MKTSLAILLATVVLSTSSPARAGLLDSLKSALNTTNLGATNSLLSPVAAGTLSQDQMVAGLKEALSKGVTAAVASLGRTNGFLTNVNVRIPIPEKLQKAESVLRLAGQGQLVDDFVGSMNHAAEQAVPVAAAVFGDSIKQMRIADAKSILTGTNDAATQQRLTAAGVDGKAMLDGVDAVLDMVPVVGAVYGTTKKVLSGCGGPRSRDAFQRFVFARLPGRTTPGFVTGSYQGVLAAAGTWVLFTDADLSAPIEELDKLLDVAIKEDAGVVIGSRAVDRSYIEKHQSRLRELGGIGFNRVVRLFLGLNQIGRAHV